MRYSERLIDDLVLLLLDFMPILVTIFLGSKSDMPVADKVTKILKEFGIEYDIHIASAHRTPELVRKIVEESSAEIFIAIAGLSAALPGIVAAHTLKPVIGVPVGGKINFDSILSMVQMPSGIPVATVGLDNGTNAAILAAQILALSEPDLSVKIYKNRTLAREKIIKDNHDLIKKKK
jgi:5-(carboxyamino)imidazole ribonucleotide mutase